MKKSDETKGWKLPISLPPDRKVCRAVVQALLIPTFVVLSCALFRFIPTCRQPILRVVSEKSVIEGLASAVSDVLSLSIFLYKINMQTNTPIGLGVLFIV